jgi:hypothetical protein
MNRRSFLTSLPFLPSAVRAVAAAAAVPAPLPGYYRADARGIHTLLRDCGRCVEQSPLDLDALFKQLYAIRKAR